MNWEKYNIIILNSNEFLLIFALSVGFFVFFETLIFLTVLRNDTSRNMISKEHLEKGFKKYTDLFLKLKMSHFHSGLFAARSGKEKSMRMGDAPVHLF